MKRLIPILFALTIAGLVLPAFAATTPCAAPTPPTTAAPPANAKGSCATAPAAEARPAAIVPREAAATGTAAPKVLFKLNSAEDAPTILRFVTNYLAVEPNAQVAVVGYAGGIDFMLRDARDVNGKPYAEQMAALADRGVAFKVCNNTLKARNLTAAAVSPPATVVPGAVNEIIRLQTNEGYAYFQN